MFRLFVITAKLPSLRPTTSSFCARRLHTQLKVSALASASSSSSRFLPARIQFTCFKGNSGSIGPQNFSRFFTSKSSNIGLITHNSSEKKDLLHQFAEKGGSGALDSVVSGHACNSVKETPLSDSAVPIPDRSGKSFYGWVGATTAAVLLSAALVFAKDIDNPTVLHDFDLTPTISEAHVLAADIWKRVAATYDRLCTSLATFVDKASEAATAITVLARCVNAVLFTKGEDYANELALRWKLRVISLLADLAASSHSRRRALIQAGNGSVIDWLLEAVGHGEQEYQLVQAEAGRALSQFLSDDITCEVVLGRPNALSRLLLFAASIQPNMSSKRTVGQKVGVFFGNDERTRGRSMLVAALMDIITSSCEVEKKGGIQPKLSGLADVTDISAALKVLQEGSLCLDEESDESSSDNGDKGQNFHEDQEIVLSSSGESSVVGAQNQLVGLPASVWALLSGLRGKRVTFTKEWQLNLTPDLMSASSTGSKDIGQRKLEAVSHGLWDDLHGNHVAVPLAAWAVATWAQASSINCGKIARLDKDGEAIFSCVMAPERTVKWHGAKAAHMVLENGFGEQAAVRWSGALLEAAKQASMVEDVQLSLMALDSFYSCIQKNGQARELAAKNSLTILRDIAKQTVQSEKLQKVIVKILELLSIRGSGLSSEEGKKWSSILLGWLFNFKLDDSARLTASKILAHVLDELGPSGISLSQAWLAMVILATVNGYCIDPAMTDAQVSKTGKPKALIQGRSSQLALQAANELAKAVLLSIGEIQGLAVGKGASDLPESDWGDLNRLLLSNIVGKVTKKDKGKLTAANTMESTLKAMKSLTELSAEDKGCQQRIVEMGGLQLLKRFTFKEDYEKLLGLARLSGSVEDKNHQANVETGYVSKESFAAQLRKHAARMLSILSLQLPVAANIEEDEAWCSWLEACADNQLSSCIDLKTCSYARATLLNMKACTKRGRQKTSSTQIKGLAIEQPMPHYEDRVFIINTDSPLWRHSNMREGVNGVGNAPESSFFVQDNKIHPDFQMDVVFVHGLCGGPFKTWRISDDKTSSTSKAGLVEKIDVDSGRKGTCWPKEWLSRDVPSCRVLTVKYKTNLSQWSGATLPLQEVSATLLQKLFAAGVGERPVVFITHSMGGLVVKQMLMQAGQDKKLSQIVKSTAGIVFYSCPHFGSKLADMPWRLGLVLRPAPSIGELRSGSVRLEELNQFIRTLHNGGLDILSFSETKVTPLVEGYGGWALRMEVVPIESAYPGFGELVVLDGTDHVNSCKPLSRDDIAYTQTLELLQKISGSVKASRP
ncbi:hypothetical protein L7F22_053234 [Adiantum nelumboides]|nr:hypothetical protein [Adiantum nelumboides]